MERFVTLYMSRDVISQKNNKPLTTQYFLLTYYLLTYLLKSNPGNPVPATGYPVPKPVPTSKSLYITADTPEIVVAQGMVTSQEASSSFPPTVSTTQTAPVHICMQTNL